MVLAADEPRQRSSSFGHTLGNLRRRANSHSKRRKSESENLVENEVPKPILLQVPREKRSDRRSVSFSNKAFADDEKEIHTSGNHLETVDDDGEKEAVKDVEEEKTSKEGGEDEIIISFERQSSSSKLSPRTQYLKSGRKPSSPSPRSTSPRKSSGWMSMDTNNNAGHHRRHTIASSTIQHIHRLLETPSDLSTASKFHSRLHGISERPADYESNTSLDAKDSEHGGADHSHLEETKWTILRELILAFLLAGLGNVAAAYMLTRVRVWSVFKNIPQLLILVQPLLGLKGNVEMTLASRLSTHANLGDMDTTKGKRSIIFGNMALVQCQASTVGFIAPIVALCLSLITSANRGISIKQMVLLLASSVITANIANLLLGTVMCLCIVYCRKYKINPDNVATPIAASLGDVTTMILLANISHFLYVNLEHSSWIQNTLLIFLMSLIPLWAYIARKNPFTSSVIVTGWFPVCGAMLLQNAGGLVMERALEYFERVTMFQPVINGIGGNVVAIQASRMSTHLHKFSEPKELPKSDPKPWRYPGFTFVNKYSAHTTMARVLILLVGPSQVIFVLITKLVNSNFDVTALFMVTYIFVAMLQVSILLQIAYSFVHWLWKIGVDPDNSAIPFLTAFADLIGSILLAAAFFFLLYVGDPNAVTGHEHHHDEVDLSTLGYDNATIT